MKRTSGWVATVALGLGIAGCSGAPPSVSPMAFDPQAGRADWWVDPSLVPLAANTKVVAGFIHERNCASGQSPEGRITGPLIDFRSDAIVVTFHVRAVSGPATCQGNPRYAMTFPLAEALGARRLLDGGVDPPRDATVDPTVVVEPTVDCGPLVGTGDAKSACLGMVGLALGDRYAAFGTVEIAPELADCGEDACTIRSEIEARTWILSATDLGGKPYWWKCTYRADIAACAATAR
jgi:hypothetical protein